MTAYSFTLRLGGVPTDHDGFVEFSNAIFHPDIDLSPAIVSGIPEVSFGWEADSLREAVAAAIAHMHRAAPSVTVVGVLTDDGTPVDEAFARVPA